VERLPNGWLRAPGYFTRVGVFVYRNLDGSLRRELRLPEEVFRPDAVCSFAMVPVTNDHPPEMLTAENTKQFAVGHTGEALVRAGDYLAGPIMVTDASAIADVEAGKQELSCGYTCELEEASGWWQGQAYDCIQRKIRGNHVALVDRGRAGPNARLQLDRFDAEQVEAERADTMKKILINGVGYEVSEQVEQAYAAEQSAQKARLDAATQELAGAKAALEREKARADSAAEDLSKEKKLRADAEDPSKIEARVKARLDLESTARKVLGANEKLDGLSEKDLKAKVVQKVYPSAQLAGKSDDYLQARFDAALESVSGEARNDANAEARQTIVEVKDAATPRDPEAVRQKTLKEENSRWQKQLRG
jgi:hypothetical protein